MKVFMTSDPQIDIHMMHQGVGLGDYVVTDSMISSSPKLKEMLSTNHDTLFTLRYSEFNQVCKILEMTHAGQRQMAFNPAIDPAHQIFVNPYSISITYNGTYFQMTSASGWLWSPFIDYRG